MRLKVSILKNKKIEIKCQYLSTCISIVILLFKMKTRNGLTYCEPIHFLQKVEQKPATLDFAEPINFLQKVEQKTESLGLAPPFPKVEKGGINPTHKLSSSN